MTQIELNKRFYESATAPVPGLSEVETLETNVLHCLTWLRNAYGVQALKKLLDGGLSPERAEAFAYEPVEDVL